VPQDNIRCPGLTSGAQEIHMLAKDLPKQMTVFYYKQAMQLIWVVFAGGTGTGKSTLFNAFCGKQLSGTGLERPKTSGPIVYAHRDCLIEKKFPIPLIRIERLNADDIDGGPVTGNPGRLMILEHNREEWSHFIVTDTPDLDSVEVENRRITEDLYLMSDLVVFITSEEKYADDVPYQFLMRIISEKKPYFFLLNKARGELVGEEVTDTLSSRQISINKDRMWLIPNVSSDPAESISKDPAFRDFRRALTLELSAEGLENLLKAERSRRAEELNSRLARLLLLLDEENQAAKSWSDRLETLCRNTCQDFLKNQRERFASDSQEYLKKEIRKLFAKYDVLSKPRGFVRNIILTPFRLLGIIRQSVPGSSEEVLLKVQKKIDLSPVQAALERFNRLVLEELSPPDENAPLFKGLRQPEVMLTDEEIKERIWEEQEKLAVWLSETFEELSRGIPKTKEWGIYSTSILWGILILSLETVIGGGFTIIDAALDSALAPFVTKGAVELFAYNEIRKIARELAERYQEGFLAVVRHQRARYELCLDSLMITPEALASLRAVNFEA